MTRLSRYMSDDHSRCDDLFATAENAVAEPDWAMAGNAFAAFKAATLRHFVLEDDILFPAFEARTGMTAGPTMVMRDEHVQIRDLLTTMADALARRDGETYLGYSETLLMLIRQHNLKEERILYPMIDRTLGDEEAALLARLQDVPA